MRKPGVRVALFNLHRFACHVLVERVASICSWLHRQWSREVKYMQDILPLSFMQMTSLPIVWMMSSPLTGVIVSCGGLLGKNLALIKVN